MTVSPCKRDCPDRCATCHATCEKYLEFRAACDRKIKQRAKNRATSDYIHDSVTKNKATLKHTEAGRRALSQR